MHGSPPRATLNQMVECQQLDRTFAALADPTRRSVLERLGRGSATISELAEPFGISLTGMKKHVRVLEDAELVTTKKVGRARRCNSARGGSRTPRSGSDLPADAGGAPRPVRGDARTHRRRTAMTSAAAADHRHRHHPDRSRDHVERMFDARATVFAAYTDPELIPEWWGPRGTTTIVDQMDVRPGGELALRHARRGRQRDRLPRRLPRGHPARADRPDVRVGAHGRPRVRRDRDVRGPRRPHEGLATSIFHTTEERDGMLASGMERGLNETYERLDELLARKA